LSKDLLLRWFGDKRMETVLAMVDEHIELTQNIVQNLYQMVCAASSGQKQEEAFYEEISNAEMKADTLRRDMTIELTKRNIYPNEREDLMELVRAVDWIADWAREAGRILSIIPFKRSPDELKVAAQDMCRADNNCVSVLADCLRFLLKDPSKVIAQADEVERIEEDIDGLYDIARKHLATLQFEDFTVGSMILLNMFLDALETVADWCENTADIVRVIAVRRT
jgi:predicted phosphate transport protein (TIGR00153 family)